MKLADWLMVLAVLSAPLVALQLQVWLDRIRAYSRRQHEVFRMLMATRFTRLSTAHIDALNRIDLEFFGRRVLFRRWQTNAERAVITAWRAYHNHLNLPMPPGGEAAAAAFGARRWEIFLDLLFAISQACGYDFDRTHIGVMGYAPQFYADFENDQTTIRKGLVAVMSGEKAVQVAPVLPPEVVEKNTAVQNAVLSQVGPDGILRVRIVADENGERRTGQARRAH